MLMTVSKMVNKMAELGTRLAHVDGGVPNIRISVPCLNEYYIGQLIYFFEIGCGISGNVSTFIFDVFISVLYL